MSGVRGCVWGAAQIILAQPGQHRATADLYDRLEELYQEHRELHGANVEERHIKLAGLYDPATLPARQEALFA